MSLPHSDALQHQQSSLPDFMMGKHSIYIWLQLTSLRPGDDESVPEDDEVGDEYNEAINNDNASKDEGEVTDTGDTEGPGPLDGIVFDGNDDDVKDDEYGIPNQYNKSNFLNPTRGIGGASHWKTTSRSAICAPLAKGRHHQGLGPYKAIFFLHVSDADVSAPWKPSPDCLHHSNGRWSNSTLASQYVAPNALRGCLDERDIQKWHCEWEQHRPQGTGCQPQARSSDFISAMAESAQPPTRDSGVQATLTFGYTLRARNLGVLLSLESFPDLKRTRSLRELSRADGLPECTRPKKLADFEPGISFLL
ncbi:hypothetical protein EDB81DRAFT_852203 [Dactylonectria macrodidyma]|uniref:Uncharacterized protein n=1 Tax=Dactylonectria macrodidyma TaxID=307937 RepID=A0A9P9FMS6_9HYPO|nr:hypothetical protein EDB81DRAFT_852203 [Dactylonectria macrodidyma]